MNARMTNPNGLPRGLAASSLLAVLLWMLAIPAMASEPCSEDVVADEPALSQIWFGEWRDDLPATVSRVVAGGGLINNAFPALSADRSQIALLYFAGHPLELGYPRFEIHSTAALELQERIELFPEHEQQQIIDRTRRSPNLRDPQLLARIESLLDEINARLREGGFRPMETLFRLERDHRLNGVEKFGKRMDYPSSANRRALTITSLSTGQIELNMEMPSGVEPYGPEGQCGWGGNPRQAWYEPELRIAVLRMTFSSSIHGCEQPERWFLKRLGDP